VYDVVVKSSRSLSHLLMSFLLQLWGPLAAVSDSEAHAVKHAEVGERSGSNRCSRRRRCRCCCRRR